MKITLSFFICYSVLNIAIAQTKLEGFQSSPKLVLEEVFRAANMEDYSNLHKLCPLNKVNDGDTQKYICDIATSSEESKAEFISYFKDARITGEIEYSSSSDGFKTAKIPFWFNHPGGESRSNETMNMINIDGKWYLLGF